MIAFFLLLTAILSFIFFGAVGEDKAFLLAPVFVLNYGLVLVWWMSKIVYFRAQKEPLRVPLDLILWFLFTIYGIFIIPSSDVVFCSKVELVFLGGVIGSFTVWRNECNTFHKNTFLINFLIVTVLFSALYGFVIHFKSPEQILWTQRYTDAYEGRLRSTYICPNHFAHLLQMLLPFLVVWLFLSKIRISLRGLAAYAFIAFLPPLFLTESRAGWLGSLTAIGALGLLLAWYHSKKLFLVMLIIIPLIGSSLLLAGYFYSETFQRRMDPVVEFLTIQKNNGIGSEVRDFRPQTWADTVKMIQCKPFFGYGPGTYRYSYPQYRERFKGQRIITGHPHNEYLELIADYGWIGFILFGSAWLCSLGRCLKLSFRSKEKHHTFVGFAAVAMILGTMVHSFFDFQMHIYPNAMIFSGLLAFAMAPMERYQKKYGFIIKNKAIVYVCSILALIGFLFCMKIMLSDYMRAHAEKKFISARSENVSSLKWAEKSIKWDESNWMAYQVKANILYDLRYYSLRLSDKLKISQSEKIAFENSYIHNEKSPTTCLGLGRVNLFLSRHIDEKSESKKYEDRGFMFLREACLMRKYNDLYWWKLGSELRNSGFYNESLEVFQKTKKMRKSGSVMANIAWLERQLDDRIRLIQEEDAEKVDYKNNNRHIIDTESLQGVLLLMESWDKRNSP